MGPNATPDDMRVTLAERFSIMKGRTTISGPTQFEDAFSAPAPLDSKPKPESAVSTSEVFYEFSDGLSEEIFLISREP